MTRRVIFKGGMADGKRKTIPDIAPIVYGFPQWRGPTVTDTSEQTYMNSGIFNEDGEEVWIPISPISSTAP